jgi:hypothetical protein
MNAYAVWDDGHQVAIPGKRLAELEVAWRQAERWSDHYATPDRIADQPALLDLIERDLGRGVAVQAAEQQRSILTHSGPRWSLQPAHPGRQAERDEAADYCPWTRDTPLPDGGAWWLVCRMSGLSIPLLPAEVTNPKEIS